MTVKSRQNRRPGYWKAYRQRNLERKREQDRKANRNRVGRGYFKEYYWRNADSEREKVRRWRKRHPGAGKEKERTWKMANRKHIQRLQNEWRNRTKKHKIYLHNRRAKTRLLGKCDPVSANLLSQLIQSLPKMRCTLCRRNMAKADRTIDHVIPLSKGGSGHIGNLQIVHAKCNSSKQARMPHELDGQLQIHLAGDVAA